MRKGLPVLLLSAAMVSGTWAPAQILAAQSGPVASATTLRMDGTIDKFDASAAMLSLTTSNGTVRIPLASTARVRQGRHTIDASKLEKLAGYRATIRYSESGGKTTVESVHVFGKNERGER